MINLKQKQPTANNVDPELVRLSGYRLFLPWDENGDENISGFYLDVLYARITNVDLKKQKEKLKKQTNKQKQRHKNKNIYIKKLHLRLIAKRLSKINICWLSTDICVSTGVSTRQPVCVILSKLRYVKFRSNFVKVSYFVNNY